jgi:hypothetical protein
MSALVDRIRPVVLLEQGERLLGASYARSVSGPTVGPSVVAVSDRRLFVAPRSAFLSASAWTRRRLRDVRFVAAPRSVLGVVVGRRFELLGGEGEAFVFELQGAKDVATFREALSTGVPASR